MTSVFDLGFIRRYGEPYDVWGATHTCAECDEFDQAAPNYYEEDAAKPYVGRCAILETWIDGRETCADVCESAWWPMFGGVCDA